MSQTSTKQIKSQQVEKSLITTYRKRIWAKFVEAVKEFELIKTGDKIAVCISGGKDSFLLAKCFQEIKKYGKQNFEVEYLVMDPGYTKENLKKIKDNLELLNIDAKIFNSDIYKIVFNMDGAPCYMCARMRRGHLYNFAHQLGCNKIALGHHFEDVIETTLLSIFYNGKVQTMMPKLKAKNFDGMQLIRPLFKVEEEHIINFWKAHDISFINCACLFECSSAPAQTKKWTDDDIGKRKEIKLLLKELKRKNANIPINIYRSAQNVCLDTVLGWEKKGEKTTFLDGYDDEVINTKTTRV